jgi:muramidase (phage lysozyme)
MTMHPSIPPFARHLLDFIGDIEAPRGYDTIYGNNQAKLAKPVTRMSIAEVIALQPSWTARFGSSATGRYQFMRATLQGLVTELRLTGAELLDRDMQDRLGFHLLKRRGYEQFVDGKINVVEFGKRLAQEWASLPVLADTRGAHREVKRGQSYYAGDGLNKSLVSPTRVEVALRTQLPGRVGDVKPPLAALPPRPEDKIQDEQAPPVPPPLPPVPNALTLEPIIAFFSWLGSLFSRRT